MNQKEKAKRFAQLHVKGAPLLLYNAWDAGSAQSVLEAGAKAIATSSWSVAAAQGYQDGEAIPIEFAEQIVGRIATSVDAPVTVDFEGGYSEDDSELADNISRLIDLGVIGVNPTPPLWHPRRDRGRNGGCANKRTHVSLHRDQTATNYFRISGFFVRR
jgi:2-methylisocitrate lyase-like PEP mutase family enzyme